jgi:glycosyltransferase involved in cell wall biosynthesis
MVVFYYTSVAYLDIALEVIHALKQSVNLHVVVEIAPESRATNILNVGSLDGLPTLAAPEQVLDPATLQRFRPYFEGCAAVHFFVQQHPKTFSLAMLRDCRTLAAHLTALQPDVIHFDTAKARALGLLPFLYGRYRNKVCITIHDPTPHTGEFNWRNILVKKGFFPKATGFLFYSAFSEKIFQQVYPKYRHKTAVIGMHAYSFYRTYLNRGESERNRIVFFGRISPYKGVDIFLKAIPLVLEKFPQEKFILAGAKSAGFQLDTADIEACKGQVELQLEHIPNERLVNMVASAKMVICPYRDATQSGVLMTAFACHTGVIAAAVGAFPEFIREGENGRLCAAEDHVALAAAIIQTLEHRDWENWTRRLASEDQSNPWLQETTSILNLYKR